MVVETADIIQMISGAGAVVKFVLLLLLLFSITSWAIIFLKFRYINKAHKESQIFTDSFWSSRNLSEAYSKSRELEVSPLARIFRTGYIELKKINQTSNGAGEDGKASMYSLSNGYSGTDNIKRALRRASNSEITSLSHLVPFLATAGNTAPFIGLFGTVWGIMSSFQEIGARGSANLAVVAPGISEALVATAAGLAVAIPSVIAYNFFVQRIKIIDSELHSFSADFLNIVERDIIRGKGAKR